MTKDEKRAMGDGCNLHNEVMVRPGQTYEEAVADYTRDQRFLAQRLGFTHPPALLDRYNRDDEGVD